jgi:NAD(P)-dependent dehydrogenase (short-subunit alcohol dehydrogenase family)
MYNPFSLEGKIILVTGASSGIGRSIAIECSKMGASVILSARNEERLNETLSQMEGNNHSVIVADFNNEEERKNLVNNLPLINGIVHCAGISKTSPFPFIALEVLTSIMNVNFTAPVLMTSELIKKKKIVKNSSVVFISSIGGVICADPGNPVYSASKGAINGIVKNMAVELAPKGIRVNCVNPGLIKTNLLDSYTVTEEQFTEKIKQYPLKRYGKPEEVAYAVIYLLSDASSFTTGSNLVIDGGFTLL